MSDADDTMLGDARSTQQLRETLARREGRGSTAAFARLEERIRRLVVEQREDRERFTQLDARLRQLEGQLVALDARVKGTMNEALAGPLRRVEERFEAKLDGVEEKLDGKAGKADHKQLVNRLWGVVSFVLLAVVGAVLAGLGLRP